MFSFLLIWWFLFWTGWKENRFCRLSPSSLSLPPFPVPLQPRCHGSGAQAPPCSSRGSPMGPPEWHLYKTGQRKHQQNKPCEILWLLFSKISITHHRSKIKFQTVGTANETVYDLWTSLLSLAVSSHFMVLNPFYVLMTPQWKPSARTSP